MATWDRSQSFWAFYLSEHADPRNRALHLFGTAAAIATAGVSIGFGNYWLLLAALGIGYLCAWVGHFLIEHNRPATFKHPFRSFAGDWRMFATFLIGRLPAELKKHGIANRS